MQLLHVGKLSRPKYHEFSLKVLIFSMLQYLDINCKTVTILFYFLIIQLTVYNRTKTRFLADDKVVYQRVRWDKRCDWLKTTLFKAFELKITVNYPVHTWTANSSFMQNLTSWSVPFCIVLLTEHKVLNSYTTNAVYSCLVAGQLYPSCGFSYTDYRCFQLSNHCQEIHPASFVHHTVLTNRDFKSKSHLSAKFCMILFNFLHFRSRQFSKVR